MRKIVVLKSKKSKLIALGVALLLVVGSVSAWFLLHKKDKPKEPVKAKEVVKEPEKVVQIVDVNSTSRPYAIMINNISTARPLQSGLQDAYIIYEIIVEGGITRYLALFMDQDTERIGSIRSARHYYLDYALENDAIYVHFGQSPQAERDLRALDVDEIEGIYYSNGDFWRTKGKYAPHNVLTTTQNILDIAERKNYRTTSSAKSVLKYIPDYDANLVDGQDALTINAKF